ncbi:hypothetical protein ACLIKD_07395 [Azonexus sp. IMCC34842]|uniref:hypothetical protein n=1 Tax=Azonexus sp. IMCC34842 TaxID=3420950 RepID=UPI003D0C76CE
MSKAAGVAVQKVVAEVAPVAETPVKAVPAKPVVEAAAAKLPAAQAVVKKAVANKVVAKKAVPAKPVAKAAATPAAPAAKPASKPVAKPVAKPVSKAKAKPAAKSVAASAEPVVPAKSGKEVKAKKVAVKKPKLVRDSFTFPENDYAQLAALKQRALSAGHEIKKSELLRAGLAALVAMSDASLLKALTAVERIKTGRPSK